MNALGNGDFCKSSAFVKVSSVFLISLVFFYLGKHSSDGHQQLVFFNWGQPPQEDSHQTPTVILSPNFNRSSDISTFIHHTRQNLSGGLHQSIPLLPPPTTSDQLPIPPPPPLLLWFGIVDENGKMADNFEVGEIDKDGVENLASENEKEIMHSGDEGKIIILVNKFGVCPESMREYIPCLDNIEAIRRLNSTENGEKFERHCPDEGHGLNCLVPPPKGYRTPIPWPQSRDEVWFSNVPHARLVEDKGGQNWISLHKDKFKFPGGGTQFIHGADHYLDQIQKMLPDIAFGRHTRVALDVGCGVASFGAYLLSRNVITLSIAPKDVHENQIQFALERGVPAMVAAFATRRLLYPSQAFDLIHCSRCRINWTSDDGIYLLEVNRILRAGGYFVWAAQPVYKHEPLLEEQWQEMINLTSRICWRLVKKEGYIAIWQKPSNNRCYLDREDGTSPPLCDLNDNPDNVWYVPLKTCITRLPDDGSGANVPSWPARLHNAPDRLQSIQMDALISRKELFGAESKYWNEIIKRYIHGLRWKRLKLRNVLDMRAGYGGFAAALIDHKLDCWVLNVIPVSEPNTLPLIYDRGLLGVMHDWCEPFDTYPRTYDLLHAAGLFSKERKRCNISNIMLEMDRILRPGGRVYIRDSLAVMDELQHLAKAVGWHVLIRLTSEGPNASYRILIGDKRLPRK
ncbi:probable methyltransferase PMT11 [Impatiens glandulifera]|uniref:probable methyltransferase PMT11 n=1 Tax=Impatiens glandulifera TaxID=253017 RepID=UPI001FB08490|nr:probable methyltransferase PMT11 [Impatiens glandulifera]